MTEANSSSMVPSLNSDAGLARYLAEIRRYPLLSWERERELAKRFADAQDSQAAALLVTSHLRLVVKIAVSYRGYGMQLSELVSEGNLGLIHAIKKFDPDRGFRLSTYARWWIRASIQEFILRSWSLVKIGTTAAQKKLFFNLRRAKSALNAFDEGDLRPEDVRQIAENLNVDEGEVVLMNRRIGMGGDSSLNINLVEDGGEWLEWLPDAEPLPDEQVASAQETTVRRQLLARALEELNPREKRIFTERRLADSPRTLEALGYDYGVSRERIRQIEARAFEKIEKAIARLLSRRAASSPAALTA